MEWTVKNVPREQWPAAFGLGNELSWYMPADVWAKDFGELKELIADVFGTAVALQGSNPTPLPSSATNAAPTSASSSNATSALPSLSPSSLPFTYVTTLSPPLIHFVFFC